MEAILKNFLHHITMLLVIIGAINWGLYGLFDINLVSLLFKAWPMAEKAVYALIGLSGLVFAGLEVKEHNHM